MYNTDAPARAELPSSAQLKRSTLTAAVVAAILLVVVVMPAEYGIDPTGIGRLLRLTGMGEIKQQLATAALADAAAAKINREASALQRADTNPSRATSAPVIAHAAAPAMAAAPQLEWRDEIPVTLAPGEGTEIKMTMAQGAKVQYAWVVQGGEVNFDTHGDGPGRKISYEKGVGVSADEGVLEAAFTGNHGWYWHNRGKLAVKVILRTRGEYSAIKQVM